MKKLILMTALVAGPLLYAQQEPTSQNDQKKNEIVEKQPSKTPQVKKLRGIN